MNRIAEFFKASWVEFTHHVTWPSYKELQSNTTLVLIGSLIFALVVGLMDLVFENGLNLFYRSF